MTHPKNTPDPLAFLRTGWARATVVAPTGSPWLPTRAVPVHVAKTVVFYSPGIVRAADARPPRR